MSGKIVHPNDQQHVFHNHKGELVGAYLPNLNIDDALIWKKLSEIQFTRVHYISQYGKANRTPRLTWAYGQIDSNMPNPEYVDNEINRKTMLRMIPNPDVRDKAHTVEYRGLNFQSEVMPDWLEGLSQFCRRVAIMNWGFDPSYNSAIIGKYDDGDDQIGFHVDDQCFLAYNLCANVTLGYARDFQFKMENASGNKTTHEIKLDHRSAFFFIGLEHALPARKAVKPGEIRYSISFRNMANNIGIGNSFYYSRGLAGAVNNDNKISYQQKLTTLQQQKI